MTGPLDWTSLRRDLAGATVEEDPHAAGSQQPTTGAGQGWEALRRDLAGAIREAEPPAPAAGQPAAVSPPSRGFPTARFPDIQPRYDRFGEPMNEAARDIETAKGGGFAPSFGGGPPLRSFRTALLGEAVTGGRMLLGLPGLAEKGLEAAGAGFVGPASYRAEAARRAAGGAPETPPAVEFARAIDPRGLIDAAMRGDEQAIMQLLAMPAMGAVGGELLRGRPGAGMVRGAAATPGAAEAFTTLGLDPATATAEDVNAAFRQAAMRTHPDVAPEARAQRGGPTDPIVAAQQFVRARAARDAAIETLGGGRPAQGFRTPPATEETQYRAQQAKAQPPTTSEVSTPPAPSSTGAPIVTPPPGRGADALRTLTDEQLAAEHPLGATPPVGASAAAPGAQEAQVTRAMGRAVKRERGGVEAQPQAPAAPGEAIPHPALSPEARIAFSAPEGDPLKVQKESLAAKIASDGPSFAPIARMRQQGATDAEIAAHIKSQGVPKPQQWVDLARTMFKIPEPGGAPTVEMPSERASGSAPSLEGAKPAPGAPHDQAAIQEALPGIGEKRLAGKEQAELLPETAGVPTAKLKAEKIAPEEVARVKREGTEPAGEKPLEAFPGKPEGYTARGARKQMRAETKARQAQRSVEAQAPGELEKFEPVTGAAVKLADGRIFTAPTHPEATIKAQHALGMPRDNILRLKPSEYTSGFVTKGGTFVTRAEAEAQLPETEGEARPMRGKSLRVSPAAGTEKLLARHAELSAQIARDEQVMGAGTSTSVFTDVGAHIGQPGQKFTRTKRTGPAYAAAGRLAQARKRLAALEKTMAPEELQQARTAAETAMPAVAEKTSAQVAPKEKQPPTQAEVEREAIEHEPDYERLARMSSSKLGAKLRAATIDRMLDYGDTREELEKLPDRELINRALESGHVPESEQTKLLDVLFGMESTGAVRIPTHALPTPVSRRTGTVDKFLKLYSPQSRGPEVAQAAESFLREYGEMVRRNDVTNARLKKYRGKVDLSQASGVEFMDRAERGLGQVSPDLQAVADIVRQEYDLRRDLVQQAEPGTLENWIENYMGRVWQHGRQAPTALQDAARLLAARRPLAGSKGFLKPRTYDYYVDGVAAGKVPVTFDGIDMAKLKLREHDRFVMATRWRRDLTARNLRAFYKSDELAPEGWVKEPEGEVWYRNERGERVRSGSHYVPEPIAQLEHNVLGPGIEGPFSNVLNAWRTLNNSLTSAILGWSGFHGYMSTMTSAFSRAALGWNKLAGGDPLGVGDILAGQTVVPAVTRNLLHGAALRAAWKNPTIVNPAMQHLAQLLAHAGGGFEMPREYQAATIAGIKEAIAQGKLPTTVGRAVALAFRAGSIPILEHYVPLIKYGAWADGARAWLKEHPTATDEETDKALQELRYQIDNRFGQVRYDTRFWNQTLKQVLQAAFFAPGWVAGSVEMVTNAMRDAAGGRFRSHAVMGLLAMVTTMATINALYQLAATGEGPKDLQDVIEPRDGTSDEFGNPNRVSPATYFKVYAAWFRAAKHLLKGQRGGGLGPVPSGLVPAFNLVHEMWTNRDYSGRMIRNPEDAAGKQFQQVAKYLVGEWEPLSARNVREAQRRGETGLRALQPVAGFTPASREAIRTPAQNMIFDILRSHTPARTPEELERSQAKREAAPQVTGDRRLLELFRHLSPDDRARVYEVTNEHERILFGPYVARHVKPYKQ